VRSVGATFDDLVAGWEMGGSSQPEERLVGARGMTKIDDAPRLGNAALMRRGESSRSEAQPRTGGEERGRACYEKPSGACGPADDGSIEQASKAL